MIELIKELKRVMEERLISPEGASRYIGCAAKSVYRWVANEVTPNLVYRQQIKNAIKKMKRDFPVIDEQTRRGYERLLVLEGYQDLELTEEEKIVWKKILGLMTQNEMADILHSGQNAVSLREEMANYIKKYKSA